MNKIFIFVAELAAFSLVSDAAPYRYHLPPPPLYPPPHLAPHRHRYHTHLNTFKLSNDQPSQSAICPDLLMSPPSYPPPLPPPPFLPPPPPFPPPPPLPPHLISLCPHPSPNPLPPPLYLPPPAHSPPQFPTWPPNQPTSKSPRPQGPKGVKTPGSQQESHTSKITGSEKEFTSEVPSLVQGSSSTSTHYVETELQPHDGPERPKTPEVLHESHTPKISEESNPVTDSTYFDLHTDYPESTTFSVEAIYQIDPRMENRVEVQV